LKLTLGVPFYGRHSHTGEPTAYEDIVQQHHPLRPEANDVPVDLDKWGGEATLGFNGVKWIEAKTAFALRQGFGGIMIWEVGQDCRRFPVRHGNRTHVRTCPGEDSSLLLAVTRAATRMRWPQAPRVRAREPSPSAALLAGTEEEGAAPKDASTAEEHGPPARGREEL